MSAQRLKNILVWSGTGFLTACLVVASVAHAESPGLSSNGMSAIWQLLYGAGGVDPDADSDGDGVPNRLEAVAGTDPFNAQSVPKITQLTVASNSAHLIFAGVLGKKYELQASESLGAAATNWVTITSLVARTNPIVTLDGPADQPMKFFRVVVSDVDTDGDGLTDWEEYQLGLDPLNAYSNGHVDGSGQPLNDYQYIMGKLASQSLANLMVNPAKASLSKSQVTLIPAGKAGGKVSLVVYPSVSSTGTGLTGQYYNGSNPIYTNAANFYPGNQFFTTNDPVIDFRWGPGMSPNLSNTLATVRWTGQVEPLYSETYVFETRTDDGVKLWVNDQLLIDEWQNQGTTSWTNYISLQSGVRYNIRMEYFNGGGNARASLYWYSPSQPRQIIPSSQLYPSSDGAVPGAVTSPLSALAFVGNPFTYTITGANTPLSFDATNLPMGLSVNSTNGVISGIPGLAGDFPVTLIVNNSIGTSTAVLDLQVIDTGSSVSREVWLNVLGNSVTNIPVNLPPSVTNTLGNLDGIPNFGDNYGERIRGFLTAPVTGNYYFWISGNNAAELWISNDEEPAGKIRRAFVANPRVTTPYQWNQQPSQRSAWLSLQAGQRYYIEILHKAGKGVNDHWSVGWLQDPTGTNTVPGGVVPGYVLSPYVATPVAQQPGTLYTANMLALPGVISTAVGSATLRVSADGSSAVLNFQINGLSSPVSSEHIDSDPYLTSPNQLIFDISAATPELDGSYYWPIEAVGTLSAPDVLEVIREGKASIMIHTVNYPAGEISGHFTAANGSPTFTPPPLPPAWTDDHTSSNAAARFLLQATFGPTPTDIKSVRSMGYANWINNQFKLPVTGHLKTVLASGSPSTGYPETLTFNTWWQRSVTAPDQLRQRVAFALSEIMVISQQGSLGGNAIALSGYYDLLLKNAFGNYRDLLKAVTLSPAMGVYLNMQGNDKANLANGTHPNENYAREIMQLFSIGLNRMWPDGSLMLDSNGNLIPTYNQDVVSGYARVFTGWNYYQPNQANKRLPNNWYPVSNYTNAMALVPPHHELGTKQLLDNAVLPAAQGLQADPTKTNFDGYCSKDLELALDSIFNNPNVGPFICRELIQRLVTSHPSRDYLYRVVQKFNDNGAGVRGDLQAVIRAILLDYEARGPSVDVAPSYGKQREPVLRATALARAFPGPAALSGSYHQSGSQTITVTTSKPHRLSSSDSVYLGFTGNPAPLSQTYNGLTITGPNTFTVSAQGIAICTYVQSGTTLTVSSSGHGLIVGDKLYLSVTSGGLASGIYTVASVVNGSVFTVTTSSSASRSGNCLFPRWSGNGYSQSGTSITFWTYAPHGLAVGNNVYVDFPGGDPFTDGTFRVTSVPTPITFKVSVSVSNSFNGYAPVVLPLTPPKLSRSGSVTLQYSSWNMGYTDSGFSSSLFQTPLNSPTVFNFFYPDFMFPGILSAAGLTTPEFQLTGDTSVVLQMNFMSGGVFSDSSNTNGLSSLSGGSISLDLSPWMKSAYTSDAGIPGLVDALNGLLCGGQLSPGSKTIIVNYVANSTRFPFTVPTNGQMRDRVRAVVHMIISSPDYIIQQ
jgi:hypothetical protein